MLGLNFKKNLLSYLFLLLLMVTLAGNAKTVSVKVSTFNKSEQYQLDSKATISQLKDKIAARHRNLKRCNLRILVHEKGEPFSKDYQLEDDEHVIAEKDQVVIVHDVSFPGGGCQSYDHEPKL